MRWCWPLCWNPSLLRMEIEIKCPGCGEDDRANLKPRREDGAIVITCQSCGEEWVRDPDICPNCGERRLVPQRLPLYQKARGTQQSIIGYRTGKVCNSCEWVSEPPPDTSAS